MFLPARCSRLRGLRGALKTSRPVSWVRMSNHLLTISASCKKATAYKAQVQRWDLCWRMFRDRIEVSSSWGMQQTYLVISWSCCHLLFRVTAFHPGNRWLLYSPFDTRLYCVQYGMWYFSIKPMSSSSLIPLLFAMPAVETAMSKWSSVCHCQVLPA